MSRPQHNRAFIVTVAWTLTLLTLGSIVHATHSSLACPDWPTCFGTMVPEMSGGVFWEHLHRLVAGGLILMFSLATFYAWRETPERPWILRTCFAGIGLLLIQAVFGGLTVLFQLPDAISTTHLGLALLFLSLAVVLAASTSPRRATRPALTPETARALRRWGSAVAALVFVQSLLGGVVRHTDAGMACPDVPTCLGAWIPPMSNELVAIHFTHRVLAVLVTIAVVALTVRFTRPDSPKHVRAAALLALVLVVIQVILGILSVVTILGVAPVSLHTLGAASLLATLVLLSTWGFAARGSIAGQSPEARDRQAAEV